MLVSCCNNLKLPFSTYFIDDCARHRIIILTFLVVCTKLYHVLLYVTRALLKIIVFVQVSKNKNGGQEYLDRLKPFTPILKYSLIDLFDEFEGKDGYSTELKSRRLHFRDPESISCVTVLPRTIAEANIPQSTVLVSSN